LEWRGDGISTALIFSDQSRENKITTFSSQYSQGSKPTFWSDDERLKLEAEKIYNGFNVDDPFWEPTIQLWKRAYPYNPSPKDTFREKVDDFLSAEGDWIYKTHYNLARLLSILQRTEYQIGREQAFAASRIFYSDKSHTHYISFWQEKDSLKPHRHVIDNYITAIGYTPQNFLYQSDDMSAEEFLDYSSFYNTGSKQLTDLEKQEKELAYQLHVKKAVLDKAILDALASKPKDVNDLYAALEQQLKMPLAKIRHVFKNVPLDKLLARNLKELVSKRRFSESLKQSRI
jgi:hypothetical protein